MRSEAELEDEIDALQAELRERTSVTDKHEISAVVGGIHPLKWALEHETGAVHGN